MYYFKENSLISFLFIITLRFYSSKSSNSKIFRTPSNSLCWQVTPLLINRSTYIGVLSCNSWYNGRWCCRTGQSTCCNDSTALFTAATEIGDIVSDLSLPKDVQTVMVRSIMDEIIIGIVIGIPALKSIGVLAYALRKERKTRTKALGTAREETQGSRAGCFAASGRSAENYSAPILHWPRNSWAFCATAAWVNTNGGSSGGQMWFRP